MEDLPGGGFLARLRLQGVTPYREEAYLFVLASIEALQQSLEHRRHVTGVELAWACRDHALNRFGVMARSVLDHWGIRTTADWGRIVYTLVTIGLLSTQPGDREEDFLDVYDFVEALDEGYPLQWTWR